MTLGIRKLVTVDQATVQEQEQVATEALALPDQARAHKVEDLDTLAVANQFYVMCHQLEKKIDKTFDPLCKATNEAHKAATKAKADAKAPVTEAKGIVKKEIESYNEVQEDIRKERERAANEEERRKAETRQIEQAASLEAQGHRELAAQVLETPINVPQVTLPSVKTELVGSGFIETFHWKIVDPKALLQAAAEGLVAYEIKEMEGTIGAAVVSIKVGKLLSAMTTRFTLPGVESWMTKDLRASGR